MAKSAESESTFSTRTPASTGSLETGAAEGSAGVWAGAHAAHASKSAGSAASSFLICVSLN
jgi:hypothetical protein